jgi:predicted permease
MPRGFRMVDQDFDVLIPMAVDRIHEKLAPFCCDAIGRLKPGVSLAQADADIARLIPVWMDSWTNGPGTDPQYYKIWRITPDFRPLKQRVIGNVSSILWVVMATVGLVLLIACTNIANLLLVRAESRQHELSIRTALGAGRRRIARELLLESVVLGLAGGVLAVGVAGAGLRLLADAGPSNLPRLSEIALDARSLGFTLLLSVLSGLLFGCIPVWRYTRARASLTMGGTSRTATGGRSHRRFRNALVIAQTAMALVLLVSALLMIRTFAALRDVQPGFYDPAQIQTMRITIPASLIPNPEQAGRTKNEIAHRIAAIPGVTAAGFGAAAPMDGIDPNWDLIYVEGKNYDGGQPPLRFFNYISPGYLHAMGTRLVAGRAFTWTDIYGGRQMVLVSENFARDTWGSAAAAIGKRVRTFHTAPWQQVIGVVENVRQHGLDEAAPAIIYWPALLEDPSAPKPAFWGPNSVTFVIRSSRAGHQEFISALQQAVWSVNADLPVASVRTMQDISNRSMARTSFTLAMLAIGGSMGLALSIVGIYGVISWSVAERRREIGIRLALGAQRDALRWMFVRSALAMTAAGVGMGLAAATLLMRLMRSLLYGVSPLDPLTYVAVPVILAAAALLASYIPARRAAAVDPIQSLRSE